MTIVERVRTLACLLLLWAVAFAAAPGRIVADTKIDLALDPWGQMARALHLWDPGATFGVLQNQGYGYLFPMAPFAALGQALLPAWVVQRLWWGLLLTVGYLATRRLLRALDVGEPGTRHVAALAFALSPRVVSTLGPISSEAAPALLAPAILLPLVLACRGELGPRRAAALSGLAVLGCGGVNATATVLATVPAGLWLVTRPGWWRTSLPRWWAAAMLASTAWWVLPLVLLGRYSPPFLDWIESADAVSRHVSLLDDLRGTSHWLGHLVTQAGPWWNAGYDLVARPGLIVTTALTAALGLAGLALRDMPERRFLLITALGGVLLLALPHRGVLASPLSHEVQAVLDGALAPLRNVHKADPLLRLPLVIGLAHVLARLAQPSDVQRRGAAATVRTVALVCAAMAALGPALPGLTGRLPSRGSFESVPAHWRDAGEWLTAHGGDGSALLVPASNFGEYVWGRPMDEVLRSLTPARTSVRDAVPLAPANTTRLLDEVESRLQTGRSLGGAVEVLRSAGVRYLVMRNDLDTEGTGAVPTTVARSALTHTPGVTLAKGFGEVFIDRAGERVRPVEVFAIERPLGEPLGTLTPMGRVIRAGGASESLADLADAGLRGPVVLDGDTGGVDPDWAPSGTRVATDGFRARDRAFGTVRGRDVSNVLTTGEARQAKDYVPWPDPSLRVTAGYDGLKRLTASTSLARHSTPSGLDPATRPFAAVDGLATTAWVAAAADDPTLDLTFESPRRVSGLEVAGFADRDRYGELLGIPTALRVTTDSGSVTLGLKATGRPQLLEGVPSTPTSRLRLTIVDTDRGDDALVTGLSSVRLPGLVVRETLHLPREDSLADAYVFADERPASDGCVVVRGLYRCLSEARDSEAQAGLDRTITAPGGPAAYAVAGALRPQPGPGLDAFLDRGTGAAVTASSRLSRAPQGRPGAVVDGDPATAWSPAPTDTQPTLTVKLPAPARVQRLNLHIRGEWLRGAERTVQVVVDGKRQLSTVEPDGGITVNPVTGRTVTVRLLLRGSAQVELPSLGLEVSELSIDGVSTATTDPEVAVPCGGGPRLLVNGEVVPTSVSGLRQAAFGEGLLSVRACRDVALHGPQSRVVLEPWGGFLPDRLALRRTQLDEASGAGAVGRPLELEGTGAATLDGRIGAGPVSILALSQNSNVGWRAEIAGEPLRPVTVDGWRQGFVVPAGEGGSVRISFAPDGPYRWGLLAGLALAGAVALGAAMPSRRRARPVGPASAPGRTWLVLALAVSWLLAGVPGLVLGVVAVALALIGPLQRFLPWAAATLLAVAGALQAVLAPGRLGEPWVEGAVRMACVAALALVIAVSSRGGATTASAAAPRSARSPRQGRW